MKVYLKPPQPSRGLQRIADALMKYKLEWVEVVSDEHEADVVVIYVIGRQRQVTEQAKAIEASGRRYAVIQVCLRSTQKPDTWDWWHLWRWAKVIWSYYDLPAAIDVDSGDGKVLEQLGNFYHAPLGVESEVFYYRGWKPDTDYNNQYIIATSGLSRLSESVRECRVAAGQLRGYTFHVGPKVYSKPPCITFSDGCSDDKLARYYSQCQFVSALRRKEGFELPAAEGLLCGARPIAFDTPDYRWIYKSWAEYIYEGTRQEVVDQLIQLFRQGARPVTQDEINEARQWFHWPTIIGGFYEKLL